MLKERLEPVDERPEGSVQNFDATDQKARTRWLAEFALLDRGVESSVLIDCVGGRIDCVKVGYDPARDNGPRPRSLPGLTMPGLANCHSHTFQRALRGVSARRAPTFDTWREIMVSFGASLTPDLYYELARATFAEMALSGITAVGEFHYLHRDAVGRSYSDPNAMGEVLIEAGRAAGVHVTLIDSCYLRTCFRDQSLHGPYRAFGDDDAEAWAARVEMLRARHPAHVAAAIHSVRAVDPESMRLVADAARDWGVPLHMHMSEQQAENRDALQSTGRTPCELASSAGVLGSDTTLVHAIFASKSDRQTITSTNTRICACPTTERDLGDGVLMISSLADAGHPVCLGSDSNMVIDIFQEAREVELNQRLITHQRGMHEPSEIIEWATVEGARSLGLEYGLRSGAAADFITLDLSSPRFAGVTQVDMGAWAIQAGLGNDVHSVVTAGRQIVQGSQHLLEHDTGRSLDDAIARAWAHHDRRV